MTPRKVGSPSPRPRPGRLARAALVVGALLLLAGLAVRPFAAEAAALLCEPRALSFFSCLYDHGSLGRGLTTGWAQWSPPGMAEVMNLETEHCPVGLAIYFFTISDADLAFKLDAVKRSTAAEPPYVRVGGGGASGAGQGGASGAGKGGASGGAVIGVIGEEEAFTEVFRDFDPTTYPVNPEAVKLVLLKAAARDWRHNQALASNHALWALALLPFEGFTSLSRLAATSLIASGGLPAAKALAGPWALGPGAAFVMLALAMWAIRAWRR